MKKYFTIAAGCLAAAVLGLAPTYALARVAVDVNIGVPGVYVQPAPVYVQPAPVYVQPGPVYRQPESSYRERQHRREWREQQRQWREQQWRKRHWRAQHDRDGDGVPNRYDRRPDNPYRH